LKENYEREGDGLHGRRQNYQWYTYRAKQKQSEEQEQTDKGPSHKEKTSEPADRYRKSSLNENLKDMYKQYRESYEKPFESGRQTQQKKDHEKFYDWYEENTSGNSDGEKKHSSGSESYLDKRFGFDLDDIKTRRKPNDREKPKITKTIVLQNVAAISFLLILLYVSYLDK